MIPAQIWTVTGGQTHSAVCVMCRWMDPCMFGSPEQNRTDAKVLDKPLVFLGPTLDHYRCLSWENVAFFLHSRFCVPSLVPAGFRLPRGHTTSMSPLSPVSQSCLCLGREIGTWDKGIANIYLKYPKNVTRRP